MKFFEWLGGKSNEEPEQPKQLEPIPTIETQDDAPYETATQRHQRLHAGICAGCGYTIDDHPRPYGLACNSWH